MDILNSGSGSAEMMAALFLGTQKLEARVIDRGFCFL